MIRLPKRLLLPLFLLYSAGAAPAMACAILTKEQAAQQHRRHVEEYKAAALAMREDADLIFVGRLTRLSFQQETVEPSPGKSQVLQKHQAVFDVFSEIKGKYAQGQVLEYTVNKHVVHVGCGPQFIQLPKENGAGEYYLVYARAGTILRTNHIPMDAQVLGGWEEAALLRDQP